jgi:hypothetical protein
MPVVPGPNDGIAKYAFCICAGKERLSDETQLGGVVNVVAGLVGLESGDELVGVVEDFLGGAGHGGHLRNFGRAGMAWMMIGPSLVSMTPISNRLAAGSAPTNNVKPSSSSSTRIGLVEGVNHVGVGDAVLACAGGDERRIHLYKLACITIHHKLLCAHAR